MTLSQASPIAPALAPQCRPVLMSRSVPTRGINLDVKKAWINTDLDIDTVIGAVTADVDLNPWIFGAGFRYYFSY